MTTVVKRDTQFICRLCEKSIMLTSFGTGSCSYCGWIGSGDNDADKINYPNPISFNKAKELLKQGKPLWPNFDEFIECIKIYGHNELFYKGNKYGLLYSTNKDITSIEFYQWNVEKNYQEYNSFEDFIAKANIEGKLLKEIWNEIEKPGFMWE